jgi:acylphosphatase
MRRLHAIVEGHVQGVYFRDYIRARAQRLGVSGWVRNTDAGTVAIRTPARLR